MVASRPTLSLLEPDDAARVVAAGPAGLVRAGALVAAADRIAARLDERGASESVVVLCSGRIAFASALLGVWRSGRRVALPPNVQSAVLADLLDREAIDAVLHDRDDRAIDVRPLLPTASDDGARIDAPVTVPEAEPIALFATSGTTAQARIVAKTGRQLIGEARALVAMGLVPPGAHVVATVPPFHLYGLLFGLLAPLLGGGVIVEGTPFFPEDVRRMLTGTRSSTTLLVSTPAHLHGLARGDAFSAPGVSVVSSGAPLPDDVHRALIEHLGLPTLDVLGSTETGGVATRKAPGARFVPFDAVTITTRGEGPLRLRSPFLPDEAPFPVADVVQVFDDGSFEHRGRTDDVVKVAGRRLDLPRLESRARALPGVTDAAALATRIEGPRGVRVNLAIASERIDADAVRRALAPYFDATALPRTVIFVPALPREATGKLSRERLAALFASEGRGSEAFEVKPSVTEADGTVTIAVRVPDDLRWFRGHFVDAPVLPAVVQVERLVAHEARAAFDDLGAVESLHRLRCHEPIGPGAELTLSLRRTLGREVAFAVRRGAKDVTTGTLVFGARAS